MILRIHKQGRHNIHSKNKLKHINGGHEFVSCECIESEESESELDKEPLKKK